MVVLVDQSCTQELYGRRHAGPERIFYPSDESDQLNLEEDTDLHRRH